MKIVRPDQFFSIPLELFSFVQMGLISLSKKVFNNFFKKNELKKELSKKLILRIRVSRIT